MLNKIIYEILYIIILFSILKKIKYFLNKILISYFNLQLKVLILTLFFSKIYLCYDI